MTKKQYEMLIDLAERNYKARIEEIRNKYVDSNTQFRVGDFIWNVTGIIKVERITYKIYKCDIKVIYIGYRYKKANGVLSRTRDKKLAEMYGDNLKKAEYEKLI